MEIGPCLRCISGNDPLELGHSFLWRDDSNTHFHSNCCELVPRRYRMPRSYNMQKQRLAALNEQSVFQDWTNKKCARRVSGSQ